MAHFHAGSVTLRPNPSTAPTLWQPNFRLEKSQQPRLHQLGQGSRIERASPPHVVRFIHVFALSAVVDLILALFAFILSTFMESSIDIVMFVACGDALAHASLFSATTPVLIIFVINSVVKLEKADHILQGHIHVCIVEVLVVAILGEVGVGAIHLKNLLKFLAVNEGIICISYW
jgi:hypothetical protein